MAFYNKLKWILGIFVVFLLIVATNLIDRNNFVRIRESIETIYEDRLIADDLIFELSKKIKNAGIKLLKKGRGQRFFLFNNALFI